MSKHTEERTGVVYKTEAELLTAYSFGGTAFPILGRCHFSVAAGGDMATICVPSVADLPAVGSMVTFTVTRGDND